MTACYILDGHEVRAEPDLDAWARWMERADRTVARSEISGFVASTAFLGIAHSFRGYPPVLFETVVFNEYGDEVTADGLEMYRYATWQQAASGHGLIVNRLKAWLRKHAEAGSAFSAFK